MRTSQSPIPRLRQGILAHSLRSPVEPIRRWLTNHELPDTQALYIAQNLGWKMQVNAVKGVVFDLDGTLLDTAPEVTDAVNDALAEAGLPQITLQQARDWVGKGAPHFLRKTLSVCVPDQTVDFDQLLTRFYHFYTLRSGTHSRVYPEVKATLAHLRSQGLHLAVLTNKFKIGTDIVLKAHDLYDYFDEVMGGDSFEQKKPDPVGVNHFMDRFGLNPDQLLFVGDSMTDVQTARNAGIQVWVVPYGYNHGQRIEEAHPDRVISNFSDLRKAFSA